MTDILKVIPLKNNLYTDYREYDIKKQIFERIQQLGIVDNKYKLDNEFLTFLVNIIEYLVQKKDKIDKKKLALDIMREMFQASEEELILISKNIEYLFNHKSIKKVSFYKLFKVSFSEWFKKKF